MSRTAATWSGNSKRLPDGNDQNLQQFAAALVSRLRGGEPDRPQLSQRELEVLRLVADGCTNSEIGRRLFGGESTVKTHLLRTFNKLGVYDRTAAVTRAMQVGLLSTD